MNENVTIFDHSRLMEKNGQNFPASQILRVDSLADALHRHRVSLHY
jgi:hypothetical protein